ncbi:sodium/glutamate symporter [Psychromarinibacter sp. S121]|uniref:sodium/glutamate symporter n=1 Tax=Psychromarinibacter sp. S121 TaxID=3415127 RepID=UPI003C7A5D63
METGSQPILVESFAAFTLGIIVYFIGARLTLRFPVLQRYSIPEPVSGGLLFALATLAIAITTGREIEFDLEARDLLLVYFFTTVGLNARFSQLISGGRLLGILVGLTVLAMVLQNLVGAVGALAFGLPPQAGVLLGTASLIGGHGTAIAWGPTLQTEYGIDGAAELGIAAATLGLIMASLLGGPIAKMLISRNQLVAPLHPEEHTATAATPEPGAETGITHVSIMRSLLWIHGAIALGYVLHEALEATSLKLPLFVPCLLSGILLSNLLPLLMPDRNIRLRGPATDLISEFSLSVFLSMSLMSMQLWTLATSAGVLTVTMALQAVTTTVFVALVVFRLMGRDYVAAVLSSGFTGFALGATPTAIANMTAVTQRYGPAPLAFILLPLVSAFLVDLANAVMIQWYLAIW